MKRKAIFGAVITALICVCIALNAKILEPTDFTGAWYRAEDGMLYIFEDGIIKCADKEIIMLDNAVFSGAYTFAKDKEILNGYYKKALPLLEKLRQLQPEKYELWLANLTNCYYNLNMTAELKEIEKLQESLGY